MIVVKVELHSALDGHVEELSRVIIANDGKGTTTHGDYNVYVGRKGVELNAAIVRKPLRKGRVLGHARLSRPVLELVRKALTACGYGGG